MFRMKARCPLGLNQVHCPNCHFNRDGECHYKAIMENPERAEELRAQILAQLCRDFPGEQRGEGSTSSGPGTADEWEGTSIANPAPTPNAGQEWEYYLKDGRGPFETVQGAMDAMGLETRPKHNRWSRLSTQLKETIQRRPMSTQLKETIQRRPKAVGMKAKFQPRDKVRFSKRATKYITAELRRRTRIVVDVFYDERDQCCFYELGARGNGTLGYFFRSFMLLPANGNQYTIGRPRQKRRYNRRTKLLFKPPNQNLGASRREAYPFSLRQRKGRVLQALAALAEGENRMRISSNVRRG